MICCMRSKILVFSSLLFVLGNLPVKASECFGEDCIIGQSRILDVGKPAPLPITSTNQTPDVEPVWDGDNSDYNSSGFDKTVDWRDGVPIWDDSIYSYKDKDFSDWTLPPQRPVGKKQISKKPAQMTFVPETIVADTESRNQVEELLVPAKPTGDIWSDKKYAAQDLSNRVKQAFEDKEYNECPFETDTECDIWRKKPMVNETVSPRSTKILPQKMDDFVAAATENKNIKASEKVAAPFLARYKMLMQSAQACCSDGMVYELKRAGASDGLVYKFLSDDANFYGLSSRCLMMSDEDLDKKYPNTATAAVAADVRNGCLCRGRQWFNAMLAPFEEAYEAAPDFAKSKFNYKYTDGLQREITVSVNDDVQNVLRQLSMCP